MATESKGLTPQQARFVAEYLVDLNGTKAAIRSGYSAKTADQQASRLLTIVKIAEAVEAGKAERAKKTLITQERVIIELAALAHSSVTHYQVNQTTGLLELAPGAPPNAMAAVSSIKYRTRTEHHGTSTEVTHEAEFRLWDKPGTLKLAGRHVAVKGFFDKVELSGPDGGPITIAAHQVARLTTAERVARLDALLAEASGQSDEDSDDATTA